jgi:hypothetical protein
MMAEVFIYGLGLAWTAGVAFNFGRYAGRSEERKWREAFQGGGIR